MFAILKRKITPKSFNIQRNVKTLRDIPTLPKYPLIGHAYLFLPGGKYKTERLTEAIQDISETLGVIFKLKLGGMEIVFTVDADHAETLCRNEGKFPIRPPFPALLHCRKKYFNSTGVVPGNGEEWYKFRQGVNPLLKPDFVQAYAEKHERIAKSFVDYVERNKNDDSYLENVFQHLFKYTIESISVVSPGGDITADTKEIIKSSVDFMDGLYDTLLGPPLWKFFKTSGYKKLESSQNYFFERMKTQLLNTKKAFYENPEMLRRDSPYMYFLVDNKSFSDDDKAMLMMEVFLGGIDATATTITTTLHLLARNESAQDAAREECRSDSSYKLTYLRACIKESLRLYATAGANSRFTIRDTEIGGYIIPKDTLVSAFGSATSLSGKYFENPLVYRPERWIRNEIKHKFASLPFGFGARMCPGRRIAEQEMVVLLKQILLKYKLGYGDDGDFGMVYRMNRIPDSKINIKFTNIN